MVNFDKTLYQETEERRPMVDGLDFQTIEVAKSNLLKTRFKEEILHVVRVYKRDKTPGPDGFL